MEAVRVHPRLSAVEVDIKEPGRQPQLTVWESTTPVGESPPTSSLCFLHSVGEDDASRSKLLSLLAVTQSWIAASADPELLSPV